MGDILTRALVLSLLGICAIASGAQAVCCAQPPSYERPARYSQFVNASTYPGGVTAAIYSGQRYLYLQAGSYTLANPVVIDRNQPLVIHGQSQTGVWLTANDPTKPLFEVRGATLFQIANLSCVPYIPRNASADCITIDKSASGAQVEAIAVKFDVARVTNGGPASFTCYDCNFAQGGLPDPIVVDYPTADVLLMGADITNGGASPIGSPGLDSYHAWQKRGRFRAYGISVQSTHGRADFRFESTSALGPNVLADVRSEGSNGTVTGITPSLAYVGAGEAVDLVVKNCGANWAPLGQGSGTLVAYNGTGHLWLYGNNGFTGAGALVSGDTTAAKIVAAGNTSFTNVGLIPNLGIVYLGDNVYAYRLLTSDTTPPKARQVGVGQTLESYGVGAVPAPPIDVIPAVPSWPTMDVLLPGFQSVKSFGAVGDGVTDDTAAIQSALNSRCGGPTSQGMVIALTSLYFPAGTYKVTSRLVHNGTGAGCHNLSDGAWIAGPDSRSAKIVRTGTGGGVFVTFGMGRSIMQGLGFEAAAGATQSAVGMEWENLDGTQVATQFDWLYDLKVVGGSVGVGIGVELATAQDSDVYVVGSRIEGATVGLASGHFNALSNACLGCFFLGNTSTWGQVAQGAFAPGGTVFLYRSNSRGSTSGEVGNLGSSSSAIFSERASTTDAPTLYIDPSHDAGNATTLQLEQVTVTPSGSATSVLDWGLAGGVTLIDSSVSRAAATVVSNSNAASLLSLYSTVTDWASTTLTGSHAQKDRVTTRP